MKEQQDKQDLVKPNFREKNCFILKCILACMFYENDMVMYENFAEVRIADKQQSECNMFVYSLRDVVHCYATILIRTWLQYHRR